MLGIEVVPLLSYVVISSFTPGPATISTSSQSILFGLRRTLLFQAGLAAGVFGLMVAGGLVSASLLGWFPALEPVLRYAGAAYILYLAYKILRASYTFGERETQPLGFGHGLVLNLSNPKLVVYSLTVFSTFLAPVTGSVLGVAAAALLLAAVAGSACLTWAVFGAAIRNRLRDPRFARWINLALALTLVYAALELAHLIPQMGQV